MDAVYGNRALGHEIENEHETVVRVGVETAALELLGGSPREEDEVAGDANISGRSPLEVVIRRSKLESVLNEGKTHLPKLQRIEQTMESFCYMNNAIVVLNRRGR